MSAAGVSRLSCCAYYIEGDDDGSVGEEAVSFDVWGLALPQPGKTFQIEAHVTTRVTRILVDDIRHVPWCKPVYSCVGLLARPYLTLVRAAANVQ